MNAYELADAFKQLQNMLEDHEVDSQAITDTMEAIEGEFEWKAEGYAKVIRNMQGSLLAVDAEIERLQNKKNLLNTSIKRLKDTLQQAMIISGKTKFKTDLFSFAIQKNGGKLPVILDVKYISELPDELVKITETADLEAIRKLIEKEGSCKYAHLGERGESLRIK